MRDAFEPTIDVVGTVLQASEVHVLRLGSAQELSVVSASDIAVARRRAEELGRLPGDGRPSTRPTATTASRMPAFAPPSEPRQDRTA